MRRLALTMLASCGGAAYELVPLERSSDCPTLACPIVAGGETRAYAIFETDVDELVHAVSVSLAPPELADVSVDNDVIAIHPAANAGTGIVTVTLDKGSFEYRISVAPGADTVVELAPYQLDAPLAQVALYQGAIITVVAEHRDTKGQPLLGHGLESWSVEGGELSELAARDRWDDVSLTRVLKATDLGGVRVSAGGPPLELGVVPAGSTAGVGFYADGHELAVDEPMHVPLGSYGLGDVVAYAADGRFVYGSPAGAGDALHISISDTSIVHVEITDAQRRHLSLFGRSRGHATLLVELDGVVREIPVDVQ